MLDEFLAHRGLSIQFSRPASCLSLLGQQDWRGGIFLLKRV
jgi:hypothetical protein